MLVVWVFGLTARLATDVDVKNGCANRNGVDFALRAFEEVAFWARRLGVFDFGVFDFGVLDFRVLDFFAMESVS
jgi:hypothetical protein